MVATRLALALLQLAASLATGRGVREPLVTIELLLSRGEHELLTAIHALQALIFRIRHFEPDLRGTTNRCVGQEQECPGSKCAAEATQVTKRANRGAATT
jgi:hypothetical protein